MTRVLEERSIGIIPTFAGTDGNVLFCIVREYDGHRGFPKGHQEEGETDKETALRELEEETGIKSIDIDENKMFAEEYTFERDGEHVHKIVKYFLGRVHSTQNSTPGSFKSEIPEMQWLTFEEAKGTLTFPGAKGVLDEVWENLNKRIE